MIPSPWRLVKVFSPPSRSQEAVILLAAQLWTPWACEENGAHSRLASASCAAIDPCSSDAPKALLRRHEDDECDTACAPLLRAVLGGRWIPREANAVRASSANLPAVPVASLEYLPPGGLPGSHPPGPGERV